MLALYAVVCRLLELIVLFGRRDRAKELEILVLREPSAAAKQLERAPGAAGDAVGPKNSARIELVDLML